MYPLDKDSIGVIGSKKLAEEKQMQVEDYEEEALLSPWEVVSRNIPEDTLNVYEIYSENDLLGFDIKILKFLSKVEDSKLAKVLNAVLEIEQKKTAHDEHIESSSVCEPFIKCSL